MKSTRIVAAIVVGGLAAGTLDILSAFSGYVPHGATVEGILQFIASGLIGRAAIGGGTTTAALGLAVHFGLTIIMAAVFVTVSLRLPQLRRHPWISGIVYGAAVWLMMSRVIVPLSAVASWKPATGWGVVGGLLAHCFFVGVPIASFARYFLDEISSVSNARPNERDVTPAR